MNHLSSGSHANRHWDTTLWCRRVQLCALLNEFARFFERFRYVNHVLTPAVAQLQHMIKIWLSPQNAVKCHCDNRLSHCMYNRLPSSHFKFQTEIDVLAKEKDERWVCNTYCSVISQILSLYFFLNHELGFYFWWAINSQLYQLCM